MERVKKWSESAARAFKIAREGKRSFSRYEWFLKKLPEPPATVLEIGCSSGDGIAYISEHGYTCTALDFPEVITNIQKKEDIEYVGDNIDGPNAENYRKEWVEKFDAVIMGEVLQHVIFDENVLYKIWHYLKPGGSLIMSTENENLVNLAVHYYPQDIMRAMLHALGFKIVASTTQGQTYYIWIHAVKLK